MGTRLARLTFIITLLALAMSGPTLLIAVRTYAPEVAAALASTEPASPPRQGAPRQHRGRNGA